MKQHIMQKNTCLNLLICLLAAFFSSSSCAQEKVKLEYKYRHGEILQYRIERFDSTSFNMGGIQQTREINSGSITSLIIDITPPADSYHIKINQDTSWTDMEMAGDENQARQRRPGGGQRGGAFNMGGIPGSGRQQRDMNIEMNKFGKSTTQEPVTSPFILELPENPVGVNDTWSYSYSRNLTGRAPGKMDVSIQCMIYDIQNNTAIILANKTSKTDIQFSGEFGDRSFSMNTHRRGDSTSLIYFDIEKGRIKEIMDDENIISQLDSGEGVTETTQKTITTIKLLNK